jgi:3'(2'), 5'-bisphosphate nucleotidase
VNPTLSESLLEKVVVLCEDAGAAIMAIYSRRDAWSVEFKSDHSPVTAADIAAHDILVAGLSTLCHGVPVLSEEAALPAFDVRRQWQTYWLVDPLDGTKEFIHASDEFTVNVALIHRGEPVLGVVHVPAQKLTYTGVKDVGAIKRSNQECRPIRIRSAASRQSTGLPLEVVASRRHGVEQVETLTASLAQDFPNITTKSIGSSLKLCLVAEGEADLYPRLAPTSEWDTAAAQAVVEAAGGAVITADGERLLYNQRPDLLNPDFYVVGDKSIPWSQLFGAT